MKREILKRSLSLVLAFGLAFSSGGNIVSAQTIQEPEIIITESDEDSIADIDKEISEDDSEDKTNEKLETTELLDETSNETIDDVEVTVIENNESQVASQKLVQGEGFTYDETTNTLTITASTGDYTSSTGNQRPYNDYKTSTEKIIVNGDANTVIGSYAYYQFTNLKEVEIKTCGNIGNRAFGQCSSLQSIKIGTCGDFETYVFQKCSALTSVEIGNCGDFADRYVFGNSSNLNSFVVTGTCGNIPEKFLYGTETLTTLSINKCGDIGDDAFKNCSSLTSVTINECGDIGSESFADSVTDISIGSCGDIAAYAFVKIANLSSGGPLKSLSIGSCESIGTNAFSYLKNLETVKIGKCDTIGKQAFFYTSGLKSVTIENCSSIDNNAFMSAGAPIEELTLENCIIEESAFYMAKITNLTLRNISSIEDAAFQSSTIETLHLDGIESLGDGVFAGVNGLTNLIIENVDRIEEGTFKVYDTTLGNNVEKITLRNVSYIGNYAFYNFNNLKEVVIEETCDYVGAHAFTGCDSLETISISDQTRLGYSDSFVNQDSIHDRVESILAGGFSLLDTSVPIETVSPEEWTSYKIGEFNSTEDVGDTQITKEAKWNDEEATTADVLLKTYYSANQQMDFIFVADCSNSMSGFGDDEAMNSNFYNMQSKMMDVAEELLNSDNWDTRIAFSTFGESEGAVSRFFEKGEAKEAKSYIWNDIANYESNTNYATGLSGALELVQSNTGRNTTVIFISDGQPYYPEEVPESYYGVSEAQAIQDEGVQIISVLQQVSEDDLSSSQANMEKISDQVYSSTDLEGFGTAINNAIDYAYTTYTVTDTIGSSFTLDEDSIVVSEGTSYEISTDQSGNTVITWTISGNPYEELTM